MKIEITEKDINQGIGGDCNHCAIAIALKRHYNTFDVYVGLPEGEATVIQVNKKVFKINEEHRETVDEFIIDFDNFRDYKNLGMETFKPKPFSFEIEEAR